MTGKEALEELLNTLKHWQGRNTIFDKMQSDCILKELDELTKYKRAFEILNLNFTLICKEDEYLCNKKYYLLSDAYNEIKKEEAELLEELMKND